MGRKTCKRKRGEESAFDTKARDEAKVRTYLDLVHVRDSVVELNWAALLAACLLRSGAICSSTRRCRRVCAPWHGRLSGRLARATRSTGSAHLGPARSVVHGRTGAAVAVGARSLGSDILARSAVLALRSLHAMLDVLGLRRLRLLLLGPGAGAEEHAALAGGRMGSVLGHVAAGGANGVDSRARRGGDADAVGVVLEAALDAVARREECVKALDEVGMTSKKVGNAANNARCVDARRKVLGIRYNAMQCNARAVQCRAISNSRLALKVLHNVKESIIDIGLLVELNLDLVQIAKRVLWRDWVRKRSKTKVANPT